MKVFKFGGASVKDAKAVKNVADILKRYPSEKILVVVSAMGKTTNALEEVVNCLFEKRDAVAALENVRAFHFNILHELFEDAHPVFNDIHNLFVELEWAIEGEPELSYAQEYDQIVSMGELLSSRILSHYLSVAGIHNIWGDARDLILTDDNFREAGVDWVKTEAVIREKVIPQFRKADVIVTQGFIGVSSDNFTTTLGREGSDYSAAIFAYCLDAKEVSIWKDVPGVLNADPKWFDETVLLGQVSYYDAIELAYYGATVIHPKTIKPLQNKHIPLYVRSFLDPSQKGTVISDEGDHRLVPSFIFKVDQVLISISPKDFSFIIEENLSSIFSVFAEVGVKINLMQNSALSFSVCIDRNDKVEALINRLKEDFRVRYNSDLELITIRYYDNATINRVMTGKEMILEQKSRNTIQLVVRNT